MAVASELMRGLGVELYIKWAFWLGVIRIILRMFAMCVNTYPRTVKWTLGEDVVAVLISAFFAFWAWHLVYA